MEAKSCTVTYNGERTESAGIGTEKILRIRLLDNLKDTPFVWVIVVESLQPPVIAQKLNWRSSGHSNAPKSQLPQL